MTKTLFNFDQFRSDAEFFLNSILKEMKSISLPVDQVAADHICFRVRSYDEYEIYKSEMLKASELLTEADVNGRPICTFRMKDPITVSNQRIFLLELPAPKPGSDYETGFEHVEFVLAEDFSIFASRYPELKFKVSGNRTLNPELCLKMKSGQVKFHHLSLDRVIEIEQAKLTDIIFDFDGTLINSRETIYEVNRQIFSEALDRPVSLDEAKEKFHPEFSKLFEAFGVDCPIKKETAISSWGVVAEKFPYSLFEGVEAFLHRVKNLGFKLHLWTARDEKSARAVLQTHSLEDLFETHSFACVSDSKPNAKSLNFDWIKASKDSLVVIGDSPTDIFGAKNISAIGAAALWDPAASKHALISSGAEIFFHDLKELETWLVSKRN